jgi:hypothetical protein
VTWWEEEQRFGIQNKVDGRLQKGVKGTNDNTYREKYSLRSTKNVILIFLRNQIFLILNKYIYKYYYL